MLRSIKNELVQADNGGFYQYKDWKGWRGMEPNEILDGGCIYNKKETRNCIKGKYVLK